jgi:uncharacterized Zn-finger protein
LFLVVFLPAKPSHYCSKSKTKTYKLNLKKKNVLICKFKTFFRHVQTIHKKLKPFQCQICKEHFSLKFNLKSHIDEVHLNLLPFKCSMCPNQTFNRSNLRTHILHHHKEKQIECNICGTKALNEKALENHILGTHEKVKNVFL